MSSRIQPGFTTVNPNTRPTPAAASPTFREPDRTIVYVRRRWKNITPSAGTDDHIWKPEPYLRPLRAREELLAGHSSATFRWHYGAAIKQPDSTAFVETPPVLSTGADWFVKIAIVSDNPQFGGAGPQPAGASEIPIWFGIIPRQSFRVFGIANPDGKTDPVGQGEQLLEAYGLDWLLDRTMPHGSHVDTNGTGFIERVLAFNERFGRGHQEVGNRGTSKHGYFRRNLFGNPTTQIANAHHFGAAGETWRYRDIAEYALETRDGYPEFTLGGDLRNLEGASEVIQHDGQSLRSILNRVIDRRRGMGAAVRCVNSEPPPIFEYDPEVNVFSLFAEPFSVGGVTIAPNANQVNVVLGGVDPHEITIEIDRSNAPEGLIVRGSALRSMFTLTFQDGSIEKAWSDADQLAYNVASNLTPDDPIENDRFRADFPNVYRRFRVPAGWDWTPGGNIALPDFGFDAKLLSPVTKVATIWPYFMAFDRELFFAEDDTADAEFMKPILFLHNPETGKYFYADRPPPSDTGEGTAPGTTRAGIRMADRGLGFEVQASTAHLIAAGTFLVGVGGTNETNAEPVVDYRSMLATVCVKTNIRPCVRVDDVLGVSYNSRHGTRLVIDVPDAEFWWITRGTYIGFNDNGLLAGANESTVPALPGTAWTDQGILIRDDSDRLQHIAALARSWYQSQRAKVRIVKSSLDNQYPLGTMIRKVVDDWHDEEIGTVVSSREWDFENHTMTIETQYVEPDFAALMG